VARTERLIVVASVASAALARGCADRVVVLADGLLVFDGPVAGFTDEIASRRLRGAVG